MKVTIDLDDLVALKTQADIVDYKRREVEKRESELAECHKIIAELRAECSELAKKNGAAV